MASATSLLQVDHHIRVLVADATRMGSQLLGDALDRSGHFNVTAAVASSADLLQAAAEGKPQVVVLSPNLDDEEGKGFVIARQLRASYPEMKLIILTDASSCDLVLEAFRVGARGVFCRSNSIDDLCKCLDVVHRGQIWATTAELDFVLQALGKSLPSRLVDSKGIALLSKREQDVIRSLSEGLTNREIAAELKLSEHTVKNYLLRIFDKLGVSNRAEAILYALRQSGPAPTVNSGGESSIFRQRPAAIFDWFQKAAARGNGLAQFVLGQMHRDGYCVPEDKVSAYMWFLLSGTTGDYVDKSIQDAKERLAGKMKADQVVEAQRRASEWVRSRSEHSSSSPLPLAQTANSVPTIGTSARSFPPRRARSFSVHPLESHHAGGLASNRK